MALNKLTDRDFRNLKAEDKVRSYPDGGGLMVRVRSIGEGGAVSFMFSYRLDGKQYRITLKANTLAAARRERDVYKDLVKQGKNPIIERQLEIHRANQKQLEEQQHIAKLNARMDVNGLFELWAKTDLRNRKDLTEIHRAFGKEVLPSLGGCLVEDVKKGDIAIIIAQLKQRGVVHMARNLLKLLRQMFRFAVSYDLIEFDPSASLGIAKMTTTPTERDRTLSEQEIKALAKQLPDAGLLKTSECAVWICLSTMCRIGELSKAKLSDIDPVAGTWVIPKENSKNGKAHTIYLSKFALEQFTRLLSYSTHPVWIFPNRTGTGNVDEKSITKQIVSRQTKTPFSNRAKDSQALILAGGKWTSHDLRRTGSTMMGDLGIPPDIIEKCLNHSEENKIKRIYQRQKLDVEQAHAWSVLGERLELLINTDGSNMILMRKTG